MPNSWTRISISVFSPSTLLLVCRLGVLGLEGIGIALEWIIAPARLACAATAEWSPCRGDCLPWIGCDCFVRCKYCLIFCKTRPGILLRASLCHITAQDSELHQSGIAWLSQTIRKWNISISNISIFPRYIWKGSSQGNTGAQQHKSGAIGCHGNAIYNLLPLESTMWLNILKIWVWNFKIPFSICVIFQLFHKMLDLSLPNN